MQLLIVQKIRCPNCGSYAERKHFANHQITETSCPACDYLMVSCDLTGRVLESYAPGVAVEVIMNYE